MRLLIIPLLLCFACSKTHKDVEVPEPGPPIPGPIGPMGKNGSNCTTTQLSTGAAITCDNGTYSVSLNGKDGSSCTTTQVSNGARIDCTDDTHSVILNGLKGDSGMNGTNAIPNVYSVTSIINPCGINNSFDEVLLKLVNGQILAHYADGQKQFLTLIGPGSYQTTDFVPCNFVVHNDGSVTW